MNKSWTLRHLRCQTWSSKVFDRDGKNDIDSTASEQTEFAQQEYWREWKRHGRAVAFLMLTRQSFWLLAFRQKLFDFRSVAHTSKRVEMVI